MSRLIVAAGGDTSNRRNTVNGKITFRYSLRLYGPRSRLHIFQMKFASCWCVLAFTRISVSIRGSGAVSTGNAGLNTLGL